MLSSCWDTASSTTRQSARATSPEAVYSQPRRATRCSRQADSVSAATLRARLAGPQHRRDRLGGRRGARFPDSLWRPLDGDTGDLTNRRTGSHPPRNVLSLCECEREPGAATRHQLRYELSAPLRHSFDRAASGDLAIDFDIQGKGEIAQLANSVRNLVERMYQGIKSLNPL